MLILVFDHSQEVLQHRTAKFEQESDSAVSLTGSGTYDDIITITPGNQTKDDEIFAYLVDLAAAYTNPVCRIMNYDKTIQLYPNSGGEAITDNQKTMLGIDAGSGPSRYAVPVKLRQGSGWIFQVAIDDGAGGTITTVTIDVIRRGGI